MAGRPSGLEQGVNHRHAETTAVLSRGGALWRMDVSMPLTAARSYVRAPPLQPGTLWKAARKTPQTACRYVAYMVRVHFEATSASLLRSLLAAFW
jgi:hypothetical protein